MSTRQNPTWGGPRLALAYVSFFRVKRLMFEGKGSLLHCFICNVMLVLLSLS